MVILTERNTVCRWTRHMYTHCSSVWPSAGLRRCRSNLLLLSSLSQMQTCAEHTDHYDTHAVFLHHYLSKDKDFDEYNSYMYSKVTILITADAKEKKNRLFHFLTHRFWEIR